MCGIQTLSTLVHGPQSILYCQQVVARLHERGASILGAAGESLNLCTETWHVDAAEAAAEAAAAAAAVASATACAIRISDALFGANAFACIGRRGA